MLFEIEDQQVYQFCRYSNRMVRYDHREDVGFAAGDRREEEYCGRQRVEEELRGGKEVIADAGAVW